MQLNATNLGALKSFEIAARQLSFTRAAQALNLTQSAVSQQIRQLEDRLGYPLFVRQARRIQLTSKGQLLFDSISTAFLAIDRTLEQLSLSNSPLQLSCLPSLALQWLLPRLTDFHRQRPELSVRLKAEYQVLDQYAMSVDDIDIAIRYDPVQYSQIPAEVILDEYLIAVASPEYLAQHPAFARGESLAGVELLHDATPWIGAPEFIEWRTWMEAAHPQWAGQIGGQQFNLSSLAITAAVNHQGVAMGRTALVYDELKSGRLVNVFNTSVQAPARYVLLCRQPDDPRVAVFSGWLRAECKRFAEARKQRLQSTSDRHDS